MTAYGFNALLAFIAAITLVYCAGDTNALFANPSQAPYVALFLNSTQSRAATVVMVVPIILCFFSALISEVATASRQLWSFARDGGLPFASFLEPVSQQPYFQPLRGMLIICTHRSGILRPLVDPCGQPSVLLSPSLASTSGQSSASMPSSRSSLCL